MSCPPMPHRRHVSSSFTFAFKLTYLPECRNTKEGQSDTTSFSRRTRHGLQDFLTQSFPRCLPCSCTQGIATRLSEPCPVAGRGRTRGRITGTCHSRASRRHPCILHKVPGYSPSAGRCRGVSVKGLPSFHVMLHGTLFPKEITRSVAKGVVTVGTATASSASIASSSKSSGLSRCSFLTLSMSPVASTARPPYLHRVVISALGLIQLLCESTQRSTACEGHFQLTFGTRSPRLPSIDDMTFATTLPEVVSQTDTCG
jgi:hypothetical protein